MGKRGKSKLLTESELEKLSTRNLLAYLRSLHSCHETPDWDDDWHTGRAGKIVKSSQAWKDNHALTKKVLAKREHIDE